MTVPRRLHAPLLGLAVAGCAGSPAPSPARAAVDPMDPSAEVGDRPTPMPPPPPIIERCTATIPGGVRRDAVVRVVDAGLGFWLRGVDVKPRLDEGRFKGWIVKRFYPGDVCYAGLDIREGDVIKKINGRSVERDTQAHDVFVGLRTAAAIVVDYEREGVARTLRVTIVDR